MSSAFLTKWNFEGDANTITEPGAYRLSPGATNANGVSDGVLLHFVARASNVYAQLVMDYNADKTALRVNWYGSWSAWRKIAFET